MIQPTIDKEIFNQLPVVTHSGNVVVVNTLEQAEAAVKVIRESHDVVGFDTETRPAFIKGVFYKVALVQLSVGKTAYLFRLNKMHELVAPLKDLLEDASIVKVGLSTDGDFQMLRKSYGELNPRGFVELQHLVKQYGIAEQSLSKIYAILFQKRISKRQRLSNWEAPELTDRQIQYAAFDAVSCVEIYMALSRM